MDLVLLNGRVMTDRGLADGLAPVGHHAAVKQNQDQQRVSVTLAR